MSQEHETLPAGLPRRLAAMAYDALLLSAMFMLAAAPVVVATGGGPQTPLARLAFQLYLLAVGFLFFAWFWTHGGQTLGMRAWRLKVVAEHGSGITWAQAGQRFLYALASWLPLGLGFLWGLVDGQGRTWHDRLSRTRLVVLPKQPAQATRRSK